MAGTITTITMPKWGLTMTEGMVAKWLVTPGSAVRTGDEIMEIETTKITNVFEAPAGGTLRRQVAPEGATVPIGGLLAVLASDDVTETEIDVFIAKFQAEFVPPADEEGERSGGPASIEAGGRRLRYLRLGPEGGLPILFLHGFGADLNTWMFNQPVLAERHATYALDLPGHGGSSKEVASGDAAALLGAVTAFMAAAAIARAHLVGHYVFDEPRAGSARAVDFDGGVELFNGACALTGREQRAAPVLKGVGFLPRQTIALEGRERFLELGFRHRVLALCRGHNRLGTLDAARESEPVLALGDDLAATFQVWQCFADIAGVCSHRGERGPGGHFPKYVSAVHGNLKCLLQNLHGLCTLAAEPVRPREVACCPQLFSAAPGRV